MNEKTCECELYQHCEVCDPVGIAKRRADPSDPVTAGEFKGFPKIPRLYREIIITEKLDGTNAQLLIHDDGVTMQAGSRNRWITPAQDNYGFARWAEDNKTQLLTLGPGRHYGEWWGQGIQRGYGMEKKYFSLFHWEGVRLPECCYVVPILYQGIFSQLQIENCLYCLRRDGSVAAPGFRDPEGIVVFHVAARQCFKITLENDQSPKSLK